VLTLILKQGLVITLVGIGIGLSAAFAVTRILAGMLFEISPTDPVAFFGAAALLFVVAVVACYVPARRAAKVDPLVALRYE
jgi:ABC-type antimicrobial peptide transport system permease subunit